MNFICKDTKAESDRDRLWEGSTGAMQRNGETLEMDVYGKGSHMHVIVGKYTSGNYVCIPDWGVGSPLASLDDRFWNKERLSRYISRADAITLTEALHAVKKADLV